MKKELKEHLMKENTVLLKKPGKGRHGTSHYAKVMYQKLEAHVSLYRSPDINKPS